MPGRIASSRGQASLELLAIVPALVVATLIAAQLGAAGWAAWSAETAARAGARGSHVGADGARVARRALPAPLRRTARVRGGPRIEVRVRIPRVVPLAPRLTLTSRASLEVRDA